MFRVIKALVCTVTPCTLPYTTTTLDKKHNALLHLPLQRKNKFYRAKYVARHVNSKARCQIVRSVVVILSRYCRPL